METIPATTGQRSQLTGLERTRFFPRQLVTPDDLTQDQKYLSEKLRRHNRLLHGWGVVCGARVKRGTEAGEVVIEPGYVLGPYGDEIVIDRKVTLNVCHAGATGDGFCGEVADPWCSELREAPGESQPLFVAVRYAEVKSRPVRVHPAGCGCDDVLCEYSRIRDSYELAVLRALPMTYDPMPEARFDEVWTCSPEKGRSCPPCPSEPWVILADVHLGDRCTIRVLDCYAHRRYVASFAAYYYRCRQQPSPEPGGHVPGHGDWIEQVDAPDQEAPRARATVQMEDGRWSSLPVYFDVEPGETFRDLLMRESGRAFLDRAAGDTFHLAEVYALANVDPAASLESIDDAVAPIEGMRLEFDNLRVARKGLEQLLDQEGLDRLDRDHAGAPASAVKLDAVRLYGVGATSPLGKALAEMRVGDLLEKDLEAVLEPLLSEVPEGRQKVLRKQAREVWRRAERVVRVSRAWELRHTPL